MRDFSSKSFKCPAKRDFATGEGRPNTAKFLWTNVSFTN